MIKKILHTFVARFLISLLNFIIVIITARFLGAYVRGEIAIFILSVTLINIINNFIGGSALVYLIPRNKPFRLVIPSYLWAIITSLLFSYILILFNLIEIKYFWHLAIISFLLSFNSVNLNVLLGKEKIALNNYLNFLQIALLFIGLIVMTFLLKENTINAYLFPMYISFGIASVISFIKIIPYLEILSLKNINPILKQFIRFGFQIQMAAIFQILNYRLSYYLIDKMYDKSMVGIFSIGVSLAEAVWLLSKSIAMVQYARIANTSDEEYSINLTRQLAKLSFFGTVLLLIPLLLFPRDGIAWIFGEAFRNVDIIILWLSPGILALSVSTVFTHYFSGKGKNMINTFASVIGLVVTVVACIIFIPLFGINGAALSASLSYCLTLIYLYIQFIKYSNSKLLDFIPNKKDFFFIKEFVKSSLQDYK